MPARKVTTIKLPSLQLPSTDLPSPKSIILNPIDRLSCSLSVGLNASDDSAQNSKDRIDHCQARRHRLKLSNLSRLDSPIQSLTELRKSKCSIHNECSSKDTFLEELSASKHTTSVTALSRTEISNIIDNWFLDPSDDELDNREDDESCNDEFSLNVDRRNRFSR